MKQTRLLVCLILTGLLNSTVAAAALGPLHTSSNQIMDLAGKPVRIAGVNWFGAESTTFAPHGLWVRNYRSMMDQMKALGFNAIRLPFSNQLFDAASTPNGIDFTANPDLQGLTGVQILDRIITYADKIGLYVVLDRHRSGAGSGPNDNGLWYTSAYPEARWIADWKMLATRYVNHPSVIGADLSNEPHGGATWGSGVIATDWRLAAERGANAILSVNPNWLIVVEGIESFNGFAYWWGGNLAGAGGFPVRLSVTGRLVYSAHDYPDSVYAQRWFSDPTFPASLAPVWNQAWGYLFQKNIAPVLLGEFGSKFIDPKDGPWMNTLAAYLNGDYTHTGHSTLPPGALGMSWAWWSWNPNSADTGGILQDDWTSVQQVKLNQLKPLMPSAAASAVPSRTPTPRAAATPTRTPVRTSTPHPTATAARTPIPRATATPTRTPLRTPTPKPTVAAGALQVRYRTPSTAAVTNSAGPWFEIVNGGTIAVPLTQLTLRYWFNSDNAGATQTFNCDWAQPGCANIKGAFVPLAAARPDANRYLTLSFGTAAGSIAAGASSGEIQTRFNDNGWLNFNQSNDYSFNPALTAYGDNPRITLYQNGKLVWGVEP